MTSIKFSKPVIAAAFVVATISTFVNAPKSFADDSAASASANVADAPPHNAVAPDVPPALPAPTKIHEGSIVKTEIQASLEDSKIENLTAPVPGNQDNGPPQPTFNALNTINTNIADASGQALSATRSDASDSVADDFSVTNNVLTYPLNDPVNGQFTGQLVPPLALRESSDFNQLAKPVMQSNYQELPLSFDDAKTRLGQLKLMAAGTRPQDALENVNQFIRWIVDIVDAHTKMAGAFSKNEATRPMAVTEKQLTTRFSYLRYQSQLLKADLLIEAHRGPEALTPLVEIVLAMPTNALGKSAYQRLQELGFSSPDVATPVVTTTSGAENNIVIAEAKDKIEVAKKVVAAADDSPKKIALLPVGQRQKKPNSTKRQMAFKRTAKVTSKKSHKP